MSRWRSYVGIRGYIGPMGSGKTYLMTADGVRALRAGREVWTNGGYRITDPETGASSREYVSLEEMVLAPPGTLLLLDEVGTFMSARRWQELPRGVMYRLTQARKDSLALIYTAQHEMQVDVALRRLTAWVYHCKRIGPGGVAVCYPPTDVRRPEDRPLGRRWYVFRKGVMAAYDTEARVWVPPEVIEAIREESTKWVPLAEEDMRALRDAQDAERRRMLGEPAGGGPAGGPRRLPKAKSNGKERRRGRAS